MKFSLFFNTSLIKKLFVAFLSLILALGALELFLRISVKPSETAWGKLFGQDLPPVKIMPVQGIARKSLDTAKTPPTGTAPREPHPPARATPEKPPPPADDGTPTHDDLWGESRSDPLLGHAPQEMARSAHGWWQTNAIGARSRKNITPRKDGRRRRIMFFGDSFTNCSRVRQEDAWPYLIQEDDKSIEVVNFGADGYGTGQCFLRFRNVASRLEYDVAVFVFVPTDLWRDINICRDLRGWETYTLVPRFIIEGDHMKLIKAPGTGKGFLGKDLDSESMDFVRRYDRFYFPEKFESPPVLGNFVLYKLFTRARFIRKEDRLEKHLLDPDSEAMKVTAKIVKSFADEAGGEGKRFVLFILPTHYELESHKKDRAYRRRWSAMISSFSREGVMPLDLMDDLSRLPVERLDRGFDGTHFGPGANRIIAGLVEKGLKKAGITENESSCVP
jgi:hypothetical protein